MAFDAHDSKQEDSRGQKELSIVGLTDLATSRPVEMEEECVPPEFNTKESSGENLRLLTDFFFCTTDG